MLENGTGIREMRAKREMTMTNTTITKDPVCGMDIGIASAAGRTEHEGQTYYFCGAKCKEKFDLDPAQYAGKAAGASKSNVAAAAR